MSFRIQEGVSRPGPVTIYVDGKPVSAHEGESLATALIAAGALIMSIDSYGRRGAPFCNMGVCFDCIVAVEGPEAAPHAAASRVRACLTGVRAGLRVRVSGQADPV